MTRPRDALTSAAGGMVGGVACVMLGWWVVWRRLDAYPDRKVIRW